MKVLLIVIPKSADLPHNSTGLDFMAQKVEAGVGNFYKILKIMFFVIIFYKGYLIMAITSP